jgi:hypothetical protein
MYVALTEVDRRLRAQYRDRLGESALMGYSWAVPHLVHRRLNRATSGR